MDIRLSDTELDIMNALWENEDMRAIDVANRMEELRGWKKNTTYTLITRLIKKGAVERIDPGFLCKPLIDRTTVRKKESQLILDKLFHRSLPLFAEAFLEDNQLSREELEELRKIIDTKLS